MRSQAEQRTQYPQQTERKCDERGYQAFDRSLDAPRDGHSDRRLYLQPVQPNSELRSCGPVRLPAGDASFGTVDVERACGSRIDFEKTGRRARRRGKRARIYVRKAGAALVIDHIGFPVSDYARSKAFYARALAPLGYGLVMEI